VDRGAITAQLAMTKRHVIEGQDHISRQHEIISRLGRAGRGHSTIAKLAHELLHTLEITQRAHVAHYDRLTLCMMHVPDNLLVERDALIAARSQRAPTQNFFGDPPPGYSALHGKTGLR
jgi:hypothetical protein